MASPPGEGRLSRPYESDHHREPPGVFGWADNTAIIPVIRVAPPPGATSSDRNDIFVMLSPSSPRQRQDHISSGEPDLHITTSGSSGERSNEQEPAGEHTCLRIWTLCGVVTFPLVLSSWLILIPWIVDISNRPEVTIPTVSLPTNSTTLKASVMPTPFNWSGVPASCRVPVTRSQTNLRVGPEYSRRRNTTPKDVGPIFCFYEPTNVGANSHWGFMFETLPFELCPNVIYSSLGIEDGYLQSRMPLDYDQKYGLHQLRTITDSLGFRSTKILVALGGHPEDAPHFSRLVRDAAILNRLVASVLSLIGTFRLDGVVLFRVPTTPNCPTNDRGESFEKLLQSLRNAFNTNKLASSLSVILDEDSVDVVRGTAVVRLVNHVFIFANNSTLQMIQVPDMCKAITSDLHNALLSYAPLVPLNKLCVVENVAPLYYTNVPLIYAAPYTGERREFYEGCAHKTFCRILSNPLNCIIYMNYVAKTFTTEYFVVTSTNHLQFRLGLNVFYPSAVQQPIRNCVLVTGLNTDNFVHQCPVTYNRYLLTVHLVYAANNWPEPAGSVFNAAPVC